MYPSAHPSPQSKRQMDPLFLHSSQQKIPILTMGSSSPPQIAPYHVGSGPPSNTWFPEPVQVLKSNGVWIVSVVFAQTTAECPYTLQWDASLLLKIAPSHRGIWTPSNNGSLRPPESSTQTEFRLVQPFLQSSLV